MISAIDRCRLKFKSSQRLVFISYLASLVFNQSHSRNIHMARIERDNQNTITIHPKDGLHSASVIFMHGLGDSADGFSDVAEMFSKSMPYTKFILPTAKTIPVTLNGGMRMPAWYDIVGLTDRASESCDGIDSSISRVHEYLEQEAALGIPYSRMALAGFSQGGALSLFCGCQLPIEKKLAGLLVMSGYLPGAQLFRFTSGCEDLPVLHCHGTADPVVKYDWALKTKGHLQSLGARKYELKSYTNVQHTVTNEILGDAYSFLQSILPDDPTFSLLPKSPKEMSVKELKEAIKRNGLSGKAVGFMEKSEFVRLLEEHYSSMQK